jgi:hypothetical protein
MMYQLFTIELDEEEEEELPVSCVALLPLDPLL